MDNHEILPHTFDLQGCRDMLDKLVRELQRMGRATEDRASLGDHAVNFALTAWHLVDWVWAEIRKDYPLRLKLAKEVGCAPAAFDRDQFALWCLRSCPDLEACQVIATATKHVRCDQEAAGEIVARVSSGANMTFLLGESRLGVGVMAPAPPPERCWVAKVEIGDRVEYAAPTFERVVGFWTQFIYGNKVDRFNVAPDVGTGGA
jgi:hypothetical protein